MPDGLDEIFADAITSNENADAGMDSDIGQNANIWSGDEDVSVETDGETNLEGLESEDSDTGNTPDGISDDVFDYSAYGDKLVAIVVDGETIRVPLKEALSGYQRQSDYTRKTQALAEDRKMAEWGREMQRAFQADPVGTLEALNNAFGYRPNAGSSQGDDEMDPELAPIYQQNQAMARELQRVQTQLQQIEQDRVLNEVRAELADVRSRYGEFDSSVVLGLAAERGLSIEDAYLLHKSRDVIAREKDAANKAARAAELAKAEQAKRDQAQRIQARTHVAVDDGDGEQIDFDDFGSMFEHNLKKSRNRV